MNKTYIKGYLLRAIKLQKKFTLDLEKIEKKLGGEIGCVTNDYVELILKKEWYSINLDDNSKLKKHKITKGQ